MNGDGSEEPRWPSDAELAPPAPLAEGEQERWTGSEVYGAVFDVDGQRLRVNVDDLAAYRALERTERWYVVATDDGSARIVKPVTSFGS